jgi:MFS family permease
MTVVAKPSDSAIPSPSTASLSGLDGVNFFVASMSAGFGPYVALYLADQKWTQQDIGFVLTAGGLAGLLSQLPGGELVDTFRSKRTFVAVGHWGRNLEQRGESTARHHQRKRLLRYCS